MADNEEKKVEGEEEAPKKGGILGMLTKLPVLIGGVMVLEGILLVAGMKMFAGGPEAADADHAEEVAYVLDDHGDPVLDDHGDPIPAEAGHGDDHVGPDELVEVEVGSFRASNHMDGRRYIYDLELSVRVKNASKDKVAAKLEKSTALIRDRMNGIIARIEPQKLNGATEPGLETLRRQVKYQLDLIVGDGYVKEVLVPRCIPYRTDY
ncbi:MAG: hypothetical protein AAGK78_06610 [Planctomycetota bacterium]